MKKLLTLTILLGSMVGANVLAESRQENPYWDYGVNKKFTKTKHYGTINVSGAVDKYMELNPDATMDEVYAGVSELGLKSNTLRFGDDPAKFEDRQSTFEKQLNDYFGKLEY